jgi:cytochrome-b5 reductase
MTLTQKEFVNHNTLFLRFALDTKHQRLGLPIGQHMSFLAQDEAGKDVYRSYTPVSDDQQLGSVDFVMKVYPQGKMSQALNRLQVGQSIMVKGPKVGV